MAPRAIRRRQHRSARILLDWAASAKDGQPSFTTHSSGVPPDPGDPSAVMVALRGARGCIAVRATTLDSGHPACWDLDATRSVERGFAEAPWSAARCGPVCA